MHTQLLSALCLALAVAGCGNGTTIDGTASNASGGSISAERRSARPDHGDR